VSTTEHNLPANLTRFTRFWYLHEFLQGFVLLYPVYAIFMLGQGLSPLELSGLFILWSGAAMAFELPTGVLADRFPRRYILIMASIVKAAAFGIWWLFPDFVGFAAGFVIWAFAGANLSGASEAYLHDQLAAADRTELFERVYGRGSAFEQAGIITALAAGGAVADAGFNLVFAGSILTCVIAALVASIGFPRGKVLTQEEDEDQTFFSAILQGSRVSLATRGVVVAIAIMALLGVIPETLDEYIGPLLDETAVFSVTSIGLLYGALSIPGLIGTALAERWRGASLGSLCLGYLLMGGLLTTFGWVGPWGIVAGLAMVFFIHGALSVLLQGYLQRRVADDARATIGSVASLALNGFALPIYAAIGAIADGHGFAGAFTMGGIFTVVVGSVLLLIATRTR
jgi:MFS family permease